MIRLILMGKECIEDHPIPHEHAGHSKRHEPRMDEMVSYNEPCLLGGTSYCFRDVRRE